MSPSGRILGGNGGARTVRVAYLERMGSIPSEAPTWHWNLASSSSSTGLMSSVKSPGRGNSVVQKCVNCYYYNWWKKTSCNLILVVSTVISGILFARFSTVECIVSKGLVYILFGQNTLNCRKTSKKNTRYSREYYCWKFIYLQKSLHYFDTQSCLKMVSN